MQEPALAAGRRKLEICCQTHRNTLLMLCGKLAFHQKSGDIVCSIITIGASGWAMSLQTPRKDSALMVVTRG